MLSLNKGIASEITYDEMMEAISQLEECGIDEPTSAMIHWYVDEHDGIAISTTVGDAISHLSFLDEAYFDRLGVILI